MDHPKNPKADEVMNQIGDLPRSGIVVQDSTGMIYLDIDDDYIFKALEVEEPVLPILESQEKIENSFAAGKEPTEKAEKSGLKVNKKTKQKKLIDSILDELASLLYVILFLILWLAPGIKLGFSGGSYYQYQRMTPYVSQEYNLINRNWRLATELKKVDSILSGTSNLRLFKGRGEVVSWEYSLMQGSVMCSYIPTPSEDTVYINQEEDVQQETKPEEFTEPNPSDV